MHRRVVEIQKIAGDSGGTKWWGKVVEDVGGSGGSRGSGR